MKTLEVFLSRYVANRMTDEQTGSFIHRFGDILLSILILETLGRIEEVQYNNYKFMNWMEEGKLSEDEAHNLCSKIEAADEKVIVDNSEKILTVMKGIIGSEWKEPILA